MINASHATNDIMRLVCASDFIIESSMSCVACSFTVLRLSAFMRAMSSESLESCMVMLAFFCASSSASAALCCSSCCAISYSSRSLLRFSLPFSNEASISEICNAGDSLISAESLVLLNFLTAFNASRYSPLATISLVTVATPGVLESP